MKKILSFTGALMLLANLSAQDYALRQLDKSPRHHEWVEVTHNDRTVHCFVVYPERSKNTTAVMVIHENRGLTDWVRSLADQLAKEGYLAIAPDMLSGFSAEMDKTSDFENADAARNAIYQLDPDQITADLNAVYDYIAAAPASNGKVAVMGFCWGGSQSFRFATNNEKIGAALVFYGTGPEDPVAVRRIAAPVYGFYGENDQRVNATIPNTGELMLKASKIYEYEIYPGAGHAFMRRADDPEGDKASRKARKKAMKWVREILSELK